MIELLSSKDYPYYNKLITTQYNKDANEDVNAELLRLHNLVFCYYVSKSYRTNGSSALPC